MANSVLAPSTHPSSLQTVLVNVTLRAILVPLNSSMIVVALPVIMPQLQYHSEGRGPAGDGILNHHGCASIYRWKTWRSDRGRNSILGGPLYFGFASLVAACSPDPAVLLSAPVQQAVGGPLLATDALALAFEIVPERFALIDDNGGRGSRETLDI